jgi:hypothetical protein
MILNFWHLFFSQIYTPLCDFSTNWSRSSSRDKIWSNVTNFASMADCDTNSKRANFLGMICKVHKNYEIISDGNSLYIYNALTENLVMTGKINDGEGSAAYTKDATQFYGLAYSFE